MLSGAPVALRSCGRRFPWLHFFISPLVLQCGFTARGLIATRRGAYDEALKHLERSLSIAPRQPEILTADGVVRVKMGQRDMAREFFARALEVDPNYQPARQQLRALEGH